MNTRTLLQLQVIVLGIGTAFSWITLIFDYRNFFAAGGTVLKFSGCAVSNPLATPCFYGALAFLIALLWALFILRTQPATVMRRLRHLRVLLIAGTLFAWGNFAYVVYRYLTARPAMPFSCPPGGGAEYPFTAPCFYGALIFTAALIFSILAGRARR